MKRIIATVGFSLFTTLALAQSPQQIPERVVPANTISIAVGRSQTFRFPHQFDGISVVSKGIVEASANTDHAMTLLGEAEGETIVRVFSDGTELYSATVTVTQEPGHIVRMFGTSTKEKPVPDYVGFYCTDRSCGRADKELNGLREAANQPPSTNILTKVLTFGR